ncbi:putative late blight resistance protein homolog R1B-17 [Rhododendron vialii]|uniref:putative late blight resistance protein homolog R1B-17 n=1 Tax=Rhododendron vialii TaxID=182163 RepID=UPI0026605433|nr:putative late blight resistance protein homolog R1B-17 [Rhododendron vialii]
MPRLGGVHNRLTEKIEALQIISIIGMGGLGKTTLANKVYKNPIVSHELSTLAWIYVSPTYSKDKLFLSILKGVTQVTSDMSSMVEDELAEEVRRQLTWKYLVVLDDVWEKKDWDSIKKAFPNHKNGSRILLTTRFKLVAVHADQHSLPYELDFLTQPRSWGLLQKKVFDGGDCPQEDLKDVGIRIAVQCDGLPLAVVVIAGMLQNDISKDAWETIAKSVKAFLVWKEEDLMEVLALSYYHLPPHLKACFLYFGVFLQDCKIHFWILIRLWIAERFVQTSENVC